MAEQVILKNKHVDITTKVARFGTTSFQVSTIGSVSVFNAKKLSRVTIILVILALISFAMGSNLKGTQEQSGQIAFAVGITFMLVGIVIQSLWPRREFTFLLKSCSGEAYKLVSEDGEYLQSLHRALEFAFVEI